MRLELGGDAGEGGARHRGGDGGHARFVPADAGVDDGGAGGFDRFRLQHDLVPVGTFRHQFEHGQTIDQDEIRPAGLADTAHDLHRETHALIRRAAPGVAAAIGAGAEELVDQIAFRAHDFDAVVAGFARQPRAVDEGLDLPLDAAGAERARLERIDRRLQGGRGHGERVIAVAAGVQDLHADAATGRVHRFCDDAVLVDLPGPAQLAGEGLEPADDVRGNAAGNHQANAALGAFAEIGGQFREVAALVFQAGVHGAHQHAVGQGAKAEIERGEQVREGRSGHADTRA